MRYSFRRLSEVVLKTIWLFFILVLGTSLAFLLAVAAATVHAILTGRGN